MSSLKADFDELRARIKHGRELGHAGFEPIYYLVFSPKQIIAVKGQTPAWVAKLHQEGWNVTLFSIAAAIAEILKSDVRRPLWLMQERKNPLNWTSTNQSLANALTTNRPLQTRLEHLLNSLEGQRDSLLLVTDLEALHPYLRIGAMETQLQGRFHVPTVFLYPGVRTGTTKLRFLGFYPEDGNYRSVHVGG